MNKQTLRDGLETIAQHEAQALAAHRAALQQRWHVARRTRTFAELLRHQIDLLPLTIRRLRDDHRQRVILLQALLRAPATPTQSAP